MTVVVKPVVPVIDVVVVVPVVVAAGFALIDAAMDDPAEASREPELMMDVVVPGVTRISWNEIAV